MKEKKRVARLQMTFMGKNADYLEVKAYLPCGGNRMRRERFQETSDFQKNYNNNMSAKKLRMLVKNNFGCGSDHFVTFTFGRKHPIDYDGVQKVMYDYFKALARYCKGLVPLRWLYVIEIGQHGRFHIHAFINADIPIDFIQHYWDDKGIGRTHFEVVVADTVQLDKLAEYMAKAPQGKHSYHTSRTVEFPETETDDGLMDAETLMEIAYASDYNEAVVAGVFEQRFPGYRFVRRIGYYSEHLMSPYLFVEMERIRDGSERRERYVELGLVGFSAA